MSLEHYDENCKGCRPALLDIQTGKPLPEDSPIMKIVLGLWEQATPQEKRAWHDFTCLNSREPQVVSLAMGVAQKIRNAFSQSEAKDGN